MEYGDLIKTYGPLALFVPLFFYLLRFILVNYKEDIESRVKLASSLDNLASIVEHKK